jgi:hypothetical protein
MYVNEESGGSDHYLREGQFESRDEELIYWGLYFMHWTNIYIPFHQGIEE